MAFDRHRSGREHVRDRLRRAFADEYSTDEVAGSFALGVFVTMLPTLGVGVLVFIALAWLSERLSQLALFAAVAVFNPVVKTGVYAVSFALGSLVLGPIEAPAPGALSASLAPEVVSRLLVGNLILAVAATVPSYVLVRRFLSW